MTFKSIAEFLDPKNGHRPTSAERDLIAKTRTGEPCRCWKGKEPSRPDGPSDDTTIRAALLRLLIIGGTKDCGLHERGVWLEGGWIKGELVLSFCAGRGAAVLAYCHFTDRPNLTQTTLPQLSLANSAFPGLLAQGAQIKGNLNLREVISKFTVDLRGANIRGGFDCTRAQLEGGPNRDGARNRALNAQGMNVEQSLILREVSTTGTVDVSSTRIGGQLSCIRARFDGDGKTAFDAQRMRVTNSFYFRKIARLRGLVTLTAAHVGNLADDSCSWPDGRNSINLNGLTYDLITGTGPITFSARSGWLKVGSHWKEEFRPQPYTQLAMVLRQMGHAGEARKVLMERERLLAVHRLESDRKDFRAAYDGGVMTKGDSGKIWLRMRGAQFWAWLTGRIAGYGYAPQRALYCALVCIGVSFFAYMLFWQLGAMVPTDAVILTSVEWQSAFDLDSLRPALVWADPSRSGPATSHYETYYSLAYAFDVFLPIVDLGQQSTWGQTTVTWAGWSARIYTWLLQAAGYVITSLGLAAATGIIQRNQPD